MSGDISNPCKSQGGNLPEIGRNAEGLPPDAGTRTPVEKLLLPYLKPHRRAILVALLLNVMAGVAVSFQNLVPKYLIDDVLMAPGLADSARYQSLFKLCLIYLFVAVVARMLVWHLGYRIFTKVREAVLLALRARFFSHVNHLCLRFHRRNDSGELFSYLFGSPLQQIQTYLQQFTFSAPGSVFMILSTILWIAAWDPVLTGVLVLLVAVNVGLQIHSQGRVRALHAGFQSAEARVSGEVADLLRGRRDVKLYSMEDEVISGFQESAGHIGRTAYARDVRGHVENMKQEGAGYLCFALLCAACAWRYLDGRQAPAGAHRLTIGEIQGYLTSFIALQGPLAALFNVSTLRAAAQAGLNRINTVLETQSTTPDPVRTNRVLPGKGDIVFDQVEFGYDPGKAVIRDFSLVIPYGQKVAVVGASGAGKSTLAQLLLRFYDPLLGSIRIGGVDLRDCRGGDVRKAFAVVPQDPFIFRTTIRQNLSVAKPDATDDELKRACERAQAWEFIERLPHGLATRVGESGATLSGGQRQRLAIARALLGEHDFFIFDEATSALDTISEQAIQSALATVMPGRTTLVIAHRLATVRSCDRILVLDHGRIVQDGSYDELCDREGLFQQLLHARSFDASDG